MANKTSVGTQDEYLDKLAKVANLTREEAKKQLFEELEKYYADEVAKLINQAREDYQIRSNEISQEIVLDAMLHGATNYVAEYTVSTVTLPNENVKGSI